MNLSDIESKQLLPRFAHSLDWIQDAFDAIIKMGVARSYTLAAPLTMESIHGLTDSELQEYYNLFGIAIYYPDLSRETREQMLYNLCRLYRFLGTPRAIEILCQYVMDDTPIEVHIDDLFAFDDSGNLRHEDLLDVFDVELSIQASELPEETLQRIYENIIRFKNDRTLLRGFSFIFDLTGGGLDVPVAYTDGGNFETFFELKTFSNAPVPYKSTGYFTWNHSQVQINAGYQRDVNPPLTAYTEGFSYRPTRYYSGVADTTGASADGLLLVNNNGNLALYNNKGTAIRIQRMDYEYEPCTVIYPNQDKTVGQCAPNGGDLSLYDNDGTRWSIKAYPQEAWRIYRAYASASDTVGFETSDLFLQRVSSSTTLRNLNQTDTITWQRAEAVRVWNPVSYSYTAQAVDGTLVYTFRLVGSGIPSTQAVHVYGYCRGRDAQGLYHYYKVEGDFVCENHSFSITVESPFDGAQNASESLIITKI
jgi:hypothetical protein